MKFYHRILLLALLSGCLIAANHSLLAQASVLEANRSLLSSGPPAPPPGAQGSPRLALEATASIDVGTSELVTASCHKSSCDLVGLRHDQMVDIAVQYPAAMPPAVVTVEALDGGQVIAPARSVNVGADGTIHFKFRAGHQPGAYRIALRRGAQEIGLQFWVRDDQHARNNPPVINPGN